MNDFRDSQSGNGVRPPVGGAPAAPRKRLSAGRIIAIVLGLALALYLIVEDIATPDRLYSCEEWRGMMRAFDVRTAEHFATYGDNGGPGISTIIEEAESLAAQRPQGCANTW